MPGRKYEEAEMKQFGTVFKFEFNGYLKNKLFVGITIFLVVAIIFVMFLPNIINFFKGKSEPSVNPLDKETMLIYAENPEFAKTATVYFGQLFGEYNVKQTTDSLDSIKDQITSGVASCAFVIDCTGSYTYYVDTLVMSDSKMAQASAALSETYRVSAMIEHGLTPEQASDIMNVTFEGKTETLGKDQTVNFAYTYIMIFALYFVIILYGQIVASNVASEKSSRAMEVLVTSAKPNSMLFGKVFASCFAGFMQLLLIFGTAIVCYNINKDNISNPFVSSMMDIPLELLIYMLIFFVLGFLIYAFMFAAIGSTATKLEDINTTTMPIMFLFVIAFMIVNTAMMGGDVSSPLMIACSYIPFTSPMAMFTRIAMSNVAIYEILLSIVILIATTFGIGVLSAKIYRVGVLLYGVPPSFTNIVKMIFKKS